MIWCWRPTRRSDWRKSVPICQQRYNGWGRNCHGWGDNSRKQCQSGGSPSILWGYTKICDHQMGLNCCGRPPTHYSLSVCRHGRFVIGRFSRGRRSERTQPATWSSIFGYTRAFFQWKTSLNMILMKHRRWLLPLNHQPLLALLIQTLLLPPVQRPMVSCSFGASKFHTFRFFL